MTQKTLKKIQLKLEEMRVSLEEQLQSFAQKDPNLKHDWDSRFPKFDGGNLEEAADEVEEYSARLPIEFSLETKLRDINLALEKIKKGKYGKCEKCGKPIPQKRLVVSPEAKLCMKCQK